MIFAKFYVFTLFAVFSLAINSFAQELDEDELLDSHFDAIGNEIQKNLNPPQSPPPIKPPTPTQSSNPEKRGPVKIIDVGSIANELGVKSGGSSGNPNPGKKNPNCLQLDPYTGYGPDLLTNFEFPDIDIVDLAKTLGRLTCISFIFDKDVRGKISIVSNAPITIGDAWKVFLSALDMNQYSLIPTGNYFRIAKQGQAKDKQIKTYPGDFTPDNDMFVTRIIRLKYINAEDVKRVFQTFMPPNSRIASYEQTNTLIVTDTGSNINKFIDMLHTLDVEGYDEKLEVIPVQFASSQSIAGLIDQLLVGTITGQSSIGGSGGRYRGNFAARRTKEGGVISNIIPDERTNAVIVSANAKGMEQVKELIQKLDMRVSITAGGSKIHVIYLQFADAEQVSQTINSLTAGSLNRGSTPATGTGSSSTQLFEGAVRIAPDKPTNSLVITASPSDFMTINSVISKLDVPRDQVYVEAIIMEMTLDKTFELGTSVAAPKAGVGFNPGNDLRDFLINPFSINGLVMGFGTNKEAKTFTIPGLGSSVTVNTVQGLIKALQTNSNANVLSTPQILTLDNQQATIEVAEHIPVLSTSMSQGISQQSVSREKISLSLTITPQINKISNFVKLAIKQKIEDISNKNPPKGVADQAFSFTSRSSDTTVIVQDGDTVALGGLVRDKVEEKSTKIPLLGDIPIIGWLFRSKSSLSIKQNLIAFITPKIIKQYQGVRKILDQKITERDQFIEKYQGGEDPHHDFKLKMIQSLPPIDQLRSGDRVENSDIEPTQIPIEPKNTN